MAVQTRRTAATAASRTNSNSDGYTSSARVSKKIKLQQLPDDDNYDDSDDIDGNKATAPLLPSAVWAKTMAYLRLSEQMDLAKVSRQLLNEVPPLVGSGEEECDFVIYDADEMRESISPHVVAQFTSVKYLSVNCLVHPVPKEGGRWSLFSADDMRLCERSARRLTLFLSKFPCLESVSIGGIEDPERLYENDFCYTDWRCKEPSNHAEIFRGLVQTFCDAYKAGTIPQTLRVCSGLIGSWEAAKLFECHKATQDGASCQLCQNVARTFPLEVVLRMDTNSQYDDLCMETFMDVCNYVDHAGAICLTHEERLGILSVRPGGKELIMEKGLENVLNRNNQHLVGSRVRVDSDGRLSHVGRHYVEALDFIHCRPWQGLIVEMEECVKHGADASRLDYENLVNRYFSSPCPARGTLSILQDTFHRLVGLGFTIHASDFRQVISVEHMEWGESFWPRYVSVDDTTPYQGDDDALSQREMPHIWTFTGGPLYIVDEQEEEDE